MSTLDLTTIVVSHPDAAKICLLDRRPRDALRAELRRHGVWWIDPSCGIANTGAFGQVLVPDASSPGDALVDCVAQMSTTFASAPSRLVPLLLYRQRLAGNARRWT